jgi:hypothetical protein
MSGALRHLPGSQIKPIVMRLSAAVQPPIGLRVILVPTVDLIQRHERPGTSEVALCGHAAILTHPLHRRHAKPNAASRDAAVRFTVKRHALQREVAKLPD